MLRRSLNSLETSSGIKAYHGDPVRGSLSFCKYFIGVSIGVCGGDGAAPNRKLEEASPAKKPTAATSRIIRTETLIVFANRLPAILITISFWYYARIILT
jgi:hypothetical protein